MRTKSCLPFFKFDSQRQTWEDRSRPRTRLQDGRNPTSKEGSTEHVNLSDYKTNTKKKPFKTQSGFQNSRSTATETYKIECNSWNVSCYILNNKMLLPNITIFCTLINDYFHLSRATTVHGIFYSEILIDQTIWKKCIRELAGREKNERLIVRKKHLFLFADRANYETWFATGNK